MKRTVLFLSAIAMVSVALAQHTRDGRSGDVVSVPVFITNESHEAEHPFVSDQDEPSQTKDSSVYDDMLVFGSLGVGFDVVNNMDFGFSTIILRENNVRILFDDTSTESGTFSSNDWSLNANSTVSGGDSYFELQDVTANSVPLRIMAGAPDNSVFVNESGRIGLGTNSPATRLHLSEGDTPTVKLEQNTSMGWSAQTWDLAGNESNFFIRDNTNGNLLPFRIKPGAPTNSLYISGNGNISLGNTDPAVRLDVEGHIALDSTLILAPQTSMPYYTSEGSLMMDGNEHLLKYHNGTEWQTISANTDEQDLVSATLTGTVLDIEIENGASVSVDLQPLLADLEARVSILEEEVLGKSTAKFSSARLFQNVPNPYSAHTAIPFYIPETVSSARMVISDASGIIIDEVVIFARGEGSLEFDQSDIETGTYFYTLILDGKQLESKVMVKVD